LFQQNSKYAGPTPSPSRPLRLAIFDADDHRLSGALARIDGKMLALQSRIAKFAAAFMAVSRRVRGSVGVFPR
jgi:hypothetical protein